MMKQSKVVFAVCILVLLVASGCKKEATAPASQAQPAADAVQADNSLSGKVVETMNSGGYTYVCLENSGKKTWVAVPETKVKVGQMVTCQPGGEMKNFTSKTLKRTFESIIFSGGIS
jgi:major membrane immunogen (membrane-anchored lipoprotein)